jgi:hypothetical protein
MFIDAEETLAWMSTSTLQQHKVKLTTGKKKGRDTFLEKIYVVEGV